MSVIDKKYTESLVSILDARTRLANAKRNNMGFAQARDAYRNVVMNNLDNLLALGEQAKDFAEQFEAECKETMRLRDKIKELEAQTAESPKKKT